MRILGVFEAGAHGDIIIILSYRFISMEVPRLDSSFQLGMLIFIIWRGLVRFVKYIIPGNLNVLLPIFLWGLE